VIIRSPASARFASGSISKPPESEEKRVCCGIKEEQFPLPLRCFNRLQFENGQTFESCCSQCRIWTSLPDGSTLKVTCFFECAFYGFGKRISI